MKKYLSALVIGLTLMLGIRQTAWAQSVPHPSPVITLSASPDKQVYVAGESIILKIALNNRTTSHQYQGVSGSSSVFALFDFDVRNAAGEQAPLTVFGRDKLKRVLGTHFDPFMVFSLIIPPGSSLDYQVVLSRLFDMSQSGTYRITALWHDPSEDIIGQQNHKHPPLLVSNQAVVRVDEPSAEFYGDISIFSRH